jgi:hypothetical protein
LAQYARTTNETNDEKEEPPENSTKEMFPITLKDLNSYDRDPRRLNNYQNSPNKHETQQSRKNIDVCDYLDKNCVCMLPIE